MKRLILIIGFFVMSVFCGCHFQQNTDKQEADFEDVVSENTIKMYRLNEERTKVVSENYELTKETPEEQVAEVLTELEAILWTEKELSGLLEKNPIQGFAINEIGTLMLYFAPDYVQVGDTTAVLRRAALVKTFCQLETISAVELYIGTQPMMRANGKPLGMLKAEDFIDSTGDATEFYQEAMLAVYFANSTGEALVESNLKITYDGTVSTERLILQQLMEGPVVDNMQPVIPKDTVLNKVTIRDGICFVDFNEKFLEKRENITAEVAVYSIVNSLTELSNVYKVQFLINGETRKTYQNLDFSTAFERNLEIVEGEQ